MQVIVTALVSGVTGTPFSFHQAAIFEGDSRGSDQVFDCL